MGKKLEVTLVSNAGLLTKYDGTTLLLDGIYGREGHMFSNLKPEIWAQMLAGKAPFEKIDYLLFTHAHPDHFSQKMTEQFLSCQQVKGVFLPDGDDISPFVDFLKGRGIPAVQFSEQTDEKGCQLEAEISIQAVPTLHLDKKYETVPHLCYLLQFGEKRVLFTADADYTHETFDEIGHLSLRAAFVNPLFFSALRYNRYFKGVLHTQTIGVYHVPFLEDDTMGMRPGVARNLAQWPGERGEAFVLWDALQSIEL